MAKVTKPTADFPLTPHYGSGQWVKKIRGKSHYFGKLEDWRSALNTYLDEKDDLLAGREPRSRQEFVTLGDLTAEFLESKKGSVASGEIQERTYKECEVTCNRIKKILGDGRALSDIQRRDLERLRAKFAEGRGPTALKNELSRARSVFLYANESGLVDKPIVYRKPLRTPSKSIFTRKRAEDARMFSAEQINSLLNAANPQLKAMLYLGINCAFGPGDCLALPWAAVDLENKRHRFARRKTGNERLCPLWPETIEALQAIQVDRKSVFMTKYQRPWTTTAIGHEFRKLLEECKIYRPGNTHYSLRRTFETIAAATGEQVAVDHIMGHLSPSMASVYRQCVFIEPLHRVAFYVRDWLQGRVKLG
ncbi:MAG TPA: tyrosine-type recombinase/integrase [Pirellulales bacterium]